MLTCMRFSKAIERPQDLDSPNGFRIVGVHHLWTRLNGVFGITLMAKPFLVVCVQRQPRNELLARASLHTIHSQTSDRTTLITIQPFPSRARVEGIKYLKPCSDILGPPGRLKDVESRVLSHELLLVTGHPSRCELLQKVPLRCETWIQEREVATAMVELVQVVTTVREMRWV